MERLTKTYENGTHGASDNLPCGENSYENLHNNNDRGLEIIKEALERCGVMRSRCGVKER